MHMDEKSSFGVSHFIHHFAAFMKKFNNQSTRPKT